MLRALTFIDRVSPACAGVCRSRIVCHLILMSLAPRVRGCAELRAMGHNIVTVSPACAGVCRPTKVAEHLKIRLAPRVRGCAEFLI